VKPAREGSSIGISKVESVEKLDAAYDLAVKLDDIVIAEQFITGRELTAAILGNEALPLVRIEAPQGNYDYHNKYFGSETKYHCPSGLPSDLEQQIQRQALAAFRIIGCQGWGRLDVMLDAENRPWFLEVNTIPGMTDHSLVPMAAKAAGISFDDLVLRILELAHVG
jgi:D-alanine-D-alanine ligase